MARTDARMTAGHRQRSGFVRFLTLFLLAASLSLGGCATIDRGAFDAAQIEAAQPADMPRVRYWADEADLVEQMALPVPPDGQPLRLLALSGGGDKGAYGAGFLNGWTQSGKRPQFTIVTGVSTGSLIAPFAFLGSAYDDQLKAAYTEISPDKVFEPRFPLAIPFSSSAATTAPLERLIARFATNKVIDAVAKEHRAGRRLFVGTANLDRPGNAIWDMGAIAASQSPRRYALFRRILLASSSVPVLFPPVLIDSQIGGRHIRELHVDGGTIATLLASPSVTQGHSGPPARQAELYLLVNGKMAGEFERIDGSLVHIAERALDVMLFSSLQDRVNSAYSWSQSVGAAYRLTYIGPEFDVKDHELFAQDFMKKLYEYGLKRGREADWYDHPPESALQGDTGSEKAEPQAAGAP